MEQDLCAITANAEIMPGIHLMWIAAPNIACSAQPGQFITVRCGDFTLRRPFSIHQVGSNNVIASPDAIGTKQSQVALLFKVTGKGTLWLSQRQPGETIDILGPSGNGFGIPATKSGESQHLLLVAGGIGIAPLVFLMQHILCPAPGALDAGSGQASSQHRITLIHGASTAAHLYPFSSLSLTLNLSPSKGKGEGAVQFIPVTEDGSMGKKGMVTDILPDYLDRADQVYACGPAGMYKAMAGLSCHSESRCDRDEESHGKHGLRVGEGLVPSRNLKLRKCQVSLEVRMGCGFGACYGCTISTKKGLKRVCRDGPVFELDDIIWPEVRI